jgi:subtilisin family serine protease
MSILDPVLADQLKVAAAHELFDVDIVLKSEPVRDALAEMSTAEGAKVTVEALMSHASRAQASLVAYLKAQSATATEADADTTPPAAEIISLYWASNSIAARVSPPVLEELARRDDVLSITPARYASIEELKHDGPKESEAAPPVLNATTIGWGVQKVKAPRLWDLGIDGTDVVVAVIDTGVNYRHPDLRNRMWQSPDPALPNHGFDFANNDNDPSDQDGHGTACAGLVAGDGTAGTATGVAPGARIMAIRVDGSQRQFWSAVEFAMDHHADVISMSLGWGIVNKPHYEAFRRICDAVNARGILHASSAGNEASQASTHPIPFNIATPANCPPPWLNPAMPVAGGVSSAVGCGATTSSDEVTSFSGLGPAEWNTDPYTDYPYNGGAQPGLTKPDLCAPGPGTKTCSRRFGTDPSAKPYLLFQGTSAATPHVAGCMALLIHASRRAGQTPNPARILEALERTAVRISGQTQPKENRYGAGRVDVYAAYKYGKNLGWWN